MTIWGFIHGENTDFGFRWATAFQRLFWLLLVAAGVTAIEVSRRLPDMGVSKAAELLDLSFFSDWYVVLGNTFAMCCLCAFYLAWRQEKAFMRGRNEEAFYCAEIRREVPITPEVADPMALIGLIVITSTPGVYVLQQTWHILAREPFSINTEGELLMLAAALPTLLTVWWWGEEDRSYINGRWRGREIERPAKKN